MPTQWLPRVIDHRTGARWGLTADQLEHRARRGQWLRVAPGIYCTSPPLTAADRLRAAGLVAGSSGMLSGAAALHLLGFGKIEIPLRPLVLIPYGKGVRTSRTYLVRPTAHLPEPVYVSGVPVAPVPRAVVDHCRALSRLGEVRAVVAEAVQRHRCSPAELAVELRRCARRDSAYARRAVAEITAGARSAPEAHAAGLLIDEGLVGFQQNVVIPRVRPTYLGDFYWDELRAVLEIDSVEYHFDQASFAYTMDRDNQLQASGVSVMHVLPSLLYRQPELFRHRTRGWLTSRARDLGVKPPWPR